MAVELDPSELGFQRPFSHEVSQVLRLHNPSKESIAFKVKTTAPKQYCVRPNSGRIDPDHSVEVQVLLQAMKEDPPLDARCRDKFLVQSVPIPSDHIGDNITQIWASIEATAKGSIQEKKIRVTFLPADGTYGSKSGLVNGSSSGVHDEAAPPAYSSPSPAAVTPQRNTGLSTLDAWKPIGAPPLSDSPRDASSSATAAPSTLSSLAAAVPTSGEDLRAQLDAAKAQIAQLQNSVTEGLRQRNVISGGEKNGQARLATKSSVQAPAGGVSVPVVAGLCLLSFLLAYVFF